MSFLSPWILLGLFAAGFPLVLHLLRRRSAGRILWGAWMFLYDSVKRKRRKLLIEDVVLLALRTLLLICAVLAFSRPFLEEIEMFGMSGGDKDVVIVIDASASMRLAGPDGRSAFDRAVEEAIDLVDRSPKGTAFGIVSGESVPAILTASPISDKGEITRLLEKMKSTQGVMDVPRALVAAGEILAVGSNPAKEVIIYGDGQKYGWRIDDKDSWSRVEKTFSRFKMRPPVVWRVLDAPPKVRNAAIQSFEPSSRIAGTDKPVTFTVGVVNAGSEPFSPGDAVLELDGKEIARMPVGQILPGLSRTFSFSHRFAEKGVKTLTASLSAGDDIASDSVVTSKVEVLDAVNVMLVDGRPDVAKYDRAGAFVEAALSPTRRGTNTVFLAKPRYFTVTELENAKSFDRMHAVVLCDVPGLSPAALANLSLYASAGGGVLDLAGPSRDLVVYTNGLFGATWKQWDSATGDVTFKNAPVAGRALFDESALPKKAKVTERFSDGRVAAFTVPYGRGRVSTFAFPLDLNWTTLPARPVFVPFVHDLVYGVLSHEFISVPEGLKLRSLEGDLKGLSEDDTDEIAVSIDLGFARIRDDALAAVLGRSFGLEIWKFFAIAALLLLLGEWFFCRRLDAERGGRIKARVHTALRTAVFLAMAWQLLHINWIHDVTRRVHRRVAVVTDRSLSMELVDAQASEDATSRSHVASNVAARLEKELASRYDVESYSFGGGNTDFAAQLEKILAAIPGEELSGVVFVTDGCDTEGAEIDAASRRFARAGAKITTVVTGSLSNRVDAAIVRLDAPETVFLGDKIRPAADVRAYGMKGRSLAVRLLEGDREIEKQTFEVDSDEWSKLVRFVYDPPGKGVVSCRVVLDAPDGDSEPRNDKWAFDTAVSDDRTNVLLIDGTPRWEFRYLRNLFYARDKSVHLQYFIAEPDRIAAVDASPAPAADATRKFGDAEAGSLPETYDDWRKFDVIIVGDVAPGVLDAEARLSIKRAVEERGAMLVVISGIKHMPVAYADDPFAQLLPVSLTNSTGEVTAEWMNAKVNFALTPSGCSHPVTMMSSTASQNERTWNSIPPARSRLAGLRARKNAETLLYGGDSTVLDAPLLTLAGFGRGKVAFFATDQTWLLRYRTGDRYHHRFWGNLLQWGAGEKLRDGNRHARVGTDVIEVCPGGKVKIVCRFSDRDSMPILDASPVAVVTTADGRKNRISLVKRQGGNGYYEGVFGDTEVKGRYTVEIEEDALKARLGELWPAKLSTFFRSGSSANPVEYVSLKASVDVPARMARLSGGKVYKAGENIDEISTSFGAGSTDVTERIEDPIWNHPFALAVIIAALAALWILRKRKGLA